MDSSVVLSGEKAMSEGRAEIMTVDVQSHAKGMSCMKV